MSDTSNVLVLQLRNPLLNPQILLLISLIGETFIKDLEGELVKAGEVRIVANSVFREKLREARVEQIGFVTPETQKRFGSELGADYMLFGTINTIVDTEGNNKVVFYQINLELIDLETNELVWIGNKKIKKYTGKKRSKKRYQNAVPQY